MIESLKDPITVLGKGDGGVFVMERELCTNPGGRSHLGIQSNFSPGTIGEALTTGVWHLFVQLDPQRFWVHVLRITFIVQ